MTAATPLSEHTKPRTRAIDWVILLAGLAVAGGWVSWAQGYGGSIALESETQATALFFVVLFGPLFPIAIVAGRLGSVTVLTSGSRPLRWAATGAAIGAGGLTATAALSGIQGGMVNAAAVTDAGLLALGAALILFQVSAEEVFFRGWAQSALARLLGPALALVLASLLFTAFHVIGGARAPVSLTTILLAGVLFGLLRERSGGLVASIAAHFAWNASENLVLGLDPNPGTDIFGAIVDLDLMGPAIWGGGPEGLNASIGTAAVLAAAILPLAAMSRRSGATAPARSRQPSPRAVGPGSAIS